MIVTRRHILGTAGESRGAPTSPQKDEKQDEQGDQGQSERTLQSSASLGIARQRAG